MFPELKKSPIGAMLKTGNGCLEMDTGGFQPSATKPLSYKGLSAESIKSIQNHLKFLLNNTERHC
jgi:hypothetical protein